MKTGLSLIVATVVVAGCGASYLAPTQRMADAESAERSAGELGAASQPAAQLHLKLALEQIELAKAAMRDGDNRRADFLLIRARADAELALALAREQKAKTEVQQASEQSSAQGTTNAIQGAAANGNQGAQK
jgi:hypothetical protein